MTIRRTCVGVVAVVMLVAGINSAEAQRSAGDWEFTLGAGMQLGADIDGERGSSLSTDDDFGLSLGFGYHLSDRLQAGFGFVWSDVSYRAQIQNEEGGLTGVRGSYESWATSANLTLNLMDGPFTPFLGAGIGWTWIDTKIPNGLPITGCWWDPWWGYVCYTSYPTKTIDAFSYQASAGIRYELNRTTFMRFNYTSQWVDVDGPTSTPRFDVLMLEVGWLF